MEVGGDVAADGGLAGADLAGKEADAAQFDEVFESRLGLAVGVGLEQLVGDEVVLEGEACEGEVSGVQAGWRPRLPPPVRGCPPDSQRYRTGTGRRTRARGWDSTAHGRHPCPCGEHTGSASFERTEWQRAPACLSGNVLKHLDINMK